MSKRPEITEEQMKEIVRDVIAKCPQNGYEVFAVNHDKGLAVVFPGLRVDDDGAIVLERVG